MRLTPCKLHQHSAGAACRIIAGTLNACWGATDTSAHLSLTPWHSLLSIRAMLP